MKTESILRVLCSDGICSQRPEGKKEAGRARLATSWLPLSGQAIFMLFTTFMTFMSFLETPIENH